MSEWNLSAMLAAIEAFAIPANLKHPQLKLLAPNAKPSHIRVRCASHEDFDRLCEESDRSASLFAHCTVTGANGNNIFWAQFADANRQPRWVEITDHRPGDTNRVDALVFSDATLADDDVHKIELGKPWEGCILRIQKRDAETIIDDFTHSLAIPI